MWADSSPVPHRDLLQISDQCDKFWHWALRLCEKGIKRTLASQTRAAASSEASLNGDRFDACGIREDTLSQQIRLWHSKHATRNHNRVHRPATTHFIQIAAPASRRCEPRALPAGTMLSLQPPTEHRQTQQPAPGRASGYPGCSFRRYEP